jgi:hypothetical protein
VPIFNQYGDTYVPQSIPAFIGKRFPVQNVVYNMAVAFRAAFCRVGMSAMKPDAYVLPSNTNQNHTSLCIDDSDGHSRCFVMRLSKSLNLNNVN